MTLDDRQAIRDVLNKQDKFLFRLVADYMPIDDLNLVKRMIEAARQEAVLQIEKISHRASTLYVKIPEGGKAVERVKPVVESP